MKEKIEVALVQLQVSPSKEENLRRAETLIDRAAGEGAELVVLPEMFHLPYDLTSFVPFAEPLPGGPTSEMLSRAARRHGIHLAGGSMAEAAEGRVFNTATLWNPRGELVLTHRKVHLYDVDIPGGITLFESNFFAHGNQAQVVRTDLGVVGLAVCHDLRFPELFRRMVLAGAEIIVVPAAFNTTSGPVHWEILVRTRAMENTVHLMACGPAPHPQVGYPAWGNSTLVDPYGNIVAAAGGRDETIVRGTMTRQRLQEVRLALPVLKQRRPVDFGPLPDPVSGPDLPWPARVGLARTPTPLEKMARLSDKLGREIYFKRDDLSGGSLSGNKVRKLEFLLAEALDQGADTVITCGGAQSNHARATAAAAAKLGLKSLLVLRTADPLSPPPAEANILLDRLVGAEIRWITVADYRARRLEIMAGLAGELKAQGRTAYVIPEGGSNATGAWGYVKALEELKSQLAALPGGLDVPTSLVYACGSGGTGAGMVLGRILLNLPVQVVGVNVCDDAPHFVQGIGRIAGDFARKYGLDFNLVPERDIDIRDGYVGLGYALNRPEELAQVRDLARLEGVVLDPVYTAKAFCGLLGELAARPESLRSRIVFFHTGGLYGLFPKAGEFSALL